MVVPLVLRGLCTGVEARWRRCGAHGGHDGRRMGSTIGRLMRSESVSALAMATQQPAMPPGVPEVDVAKEVRKLKKVGDESDE